MRNMKRIFLASLCLGLAVPVAAQAPAGTAISAGMAVKDSNGGDVGTIAKVDGQFVVVKTDKHEVRLPATSFTPHQGALLFGMTRDQLNAEVDRSLAAAAARLGPGATVADPAGATIGAITAIDAQWVTVKLTSGTELRLPRSAVAAGPNGAVVGSTAAQLEAAAKAAAPAATPAAPATPQGQ
jgi:preprotein translocase subunit YajC